MDTVEDMSKTGESLKSTRWLTWLAVVALVYMLLIGVGIVGDGFKWVSGGSAGAEQIFKFASNPLVGVILGTLATAMVQSSSTVTSVIVGLVAGGVPVSTAVPMIMGANMGTTITNTIVSLGAIRNRSAFNRSFQAATVHDFFNLYSIVIFLPIELIFHPLERIAGWLSSALVGSASASMSDLNFIGALTKPVSKAIVGVFHHIPGEQLGGILVIFLGIAVIMGSVFYLGSLLRSVMTGKARDVIHKSIGRGPVSGILSGTLVTVLVQSSSTTTSLIVPLAASGTLNVRQVFPFTMGANIGTCITAVLAATAISGPFAMVAMQIALVHLLYNIFGVLLFTLTPGLRITPINSATWLGNRTERNRLWAFGYIFSVFFVTPGIVFAGQASFNNKNMDAVDALSKEQKMEKTDKAVHEDALRIE